MVFQPTYFSPIIQFQKLINNDKCVFEVQDNYQKQSYRTRFSIYSPQGKQDLYIPVQHKKGIKLLTKEVKIENRYKWQRKHFKSLQNSYRSSPFFEYYEDDLALIFDKKEKYLLDFLLKTQDLSFDMLQHNMEITKTTEYRTDYPVEEDFRFLEKPKLNFEEIIFPKYTQVFENKHGFIPNLSILDLLFNEGPNSVTLLK